MLADCGSAGVPKSRNHRVVTARRRSVGTSIGSWSRRWLYGSGPFCACAWWAGLASPAWSSLAAGVVDRGGVGWVHRSRAGIGSAGAARRAGAWKGPANYCVSCVTRSASLTPRMRTRQDRWPGWVWRGREAVGERDQREDQRRGGRAAGLSCQDGGGVSADGRRMLLLTAGAGR